MLCHGDELGRTQQGNNNAYCQDNELTWLDWDLTDEQKALCEFIAELVHFRLAQPVLRRRKFFQGRSIRGGVKDVAWFAPDGREMTDEAWNADFVRSLGMLLSGDAIDEVDERGEPIIGDTLLVLLNAHTTRCRSRCRRSTPTSMAARLRHRRPARRPSALFKRRRPLSACRAVGRRLQGDAAAARAAPRRRADDNDAATPAGRSRRSRNRSRSAAES